MISFIVAMDEQGTIGKNNNLPWHLPDDLRRFKKITMGHPIVMGRKTFESIGKPLPGRENVILTHNKHFHPDGCTVFHSEQEILDFCNNKDEESFIIGGAEIFRLFIPYVKRLHVTKINHSFNGDVFFPDINWADFEVISIEKGNKDNLEPYQFEYITYERKIDL